MVELHLEINVFLVSQTKVSVLSGVTVCMSLAASKPVTNFALRVEEMLST